MKITAQEEYGLRILLRIANCQDAEGMSIPQISEAEGLSSHYVAKLTRLLRMEGFINSTAGYKGGYVLANPAREININKVLKALGGALFSAAFCGDHPGTLKLCVNSVDCSTRSLWQMIQSRIDQLLDQVNLSDLMHAENKTGEILQQLIRQVDPGIAIQPQD
ncbi:RrF2 family transcriptional regulator [Flavihumibacter fluvii]|uniref:RrF2 family transcriptional regulator n=1 Tax=Flavihumibacter fluvii TaxID=2838157 RepID=UPI001BDE534D|nr:Rrf2 family transcriptional regulator [Flavihumibacter fluvii]ULQ52963.1 Rrf2 family transcriptional regulator [Flavihumibacter fluvii]